MGSSFFPFSNKVPLYLRGHVTRQRMDALSVGKDRADFTLHQPAEELRQSVDTLGGDREDLTLEVIYLPKYGDMLESALVQAVHDFEQKVTSKKGYTDYCLKEYNDTEVYYEQHNDTAKLEVINNMERPCAVHETIFWSCDPSLGVDCLSLESLPIGIMYCPKDNQSCSPSEMTVNGTFKSLKTDVYAKSVPDIRTVGGLNSWDFLKLVDSHFGSGNQIVKAARTVFTFGVPFKGYRTVGEDIDGHSTKLSHWLYDTYNDYLMSGQLDSPDVHYVFNGHGMLGLYIGTKLVHDGMFMIASMFFVLFYIAFMTSSWWLSLMGMGQIVMSTGPAYFMYYGVFQQRYFGVFNMLCIFIILGIGADDIFVFLDTWEQSADVIPKHLHWKRMAWTWKHAGKAMLVTSLSTMISFVANANSSFPAIQTFGIFASLLVMVNYFAVMIFFPTVVLVYAAKFEDMVFCCGLTSAFSKLLDGISKERKRRKQVAPDENDDSPTTLNPTIEKDRENRSDLVISTAGSDEGRSPPLDPPMDPPQSPDPGSPIEGHSQPSGVTTWFRTAYADGIIRARIVLLAIFLALGAGMMVSAVSIAPDPNNPQFFPSTDNYQQFTDAKPAYFMRGGSVDAIKITLAWGFNSKHPIDRAGTKATDMDNLGDPVWDPSFSLPVASQCILHICEAAEVKSDSRKTGGYPDFPIDCFMTNFKRYVDANSSSLWGEITGIGADENLYFEVLIRWLSDPVTLSKWKPYIYGEAVPGVGPVLRFVTAELKLTLTTSIEASSAISLWHVWENWFNGQYQVEPCKAVASKAAGFQSSMAFAFVRDRLVSEALQGIYTSVSLAFCVLVVATTNIVISIYAVAVISFIVSCTMGTIVLLGWKLGVLESIGLVMVPGLSVDFVAHLAEAYIDSHYTDREGRLRDMLGRVGISIVSGAISTLGASAFLFFPVIIFFNKFGIMMFMTIGYSLLWSLLFFPAVLTTPLGPQGHTGNWLYLLRKVIARIKDKQ
eukprot:TRINITY_DN20128_c0_g1_i2.p1 TRINITY_DN20128_c0_g1~~TRINITY_DN20128_c0_g1_i2.p1  ORF type:complete len:1050 (+),score=167.96 TRINITY_DN20128_c0_g1_i2:157-3150(+)